jgi:hypothetical protein
LREDEWAEPLRTAMPGIRCLTLSEGTRDSDRSYEQTAMRLFNVLQQILKDRSSGGVLVQLVVPKDAEGSRGLGALLKTAELESSKLRCQLIGVESGETTATLVRKLNSNARWGRGGAIRYQEGRRQVEVLREIAALEERNRETAA